ncbi:MAG: hypothetical protein ACPG31_00690 [Planctomycetota bacterium]
MNGPSAPRSAGTGRATRPTTPTRPTSPTSPGSPRGPATPGSPAAPGAPVTLGGAPLPLEHGRTAKTFLTMRWDYPVHAFFTKERSQAFTAAKAYQTALPRAEAFARVAEEDRRPLLVLRECHTCNGTDDALFSHPTGNERTLIMARWFHVVKLPVSVMHQDHIFRNLFPQDDAPHVFVSSFDGSNVIPLEGDATPLQVQKAMFKVMAKDYEGSAKSAVKRIEYLVAQYDMLDEKITRLERSYESEVEKNGEESRKADKLFAEKQELEAELAELRLEEKQVSALELVQTEEV